MRTRPHTISTRLSEAERAELARQLRAPGGWYVPAQFARWALLRDGGPAFRAAAVTLDPRPLADLRRGLVTHGRTLNWLAVAANASRRAPRLDTLQRLFARWPALCASLTAALEVPKPAPVALPVPVQATPPAAVLSAAPTPRQQHQGRRQRQTVVATRLDARELAAFEAAARYAGVDPADYFRAKLLNFAPLRRARLARSVAFVLGRILHELGKQDSNVDQLVRHYATPPRDLVEAAQDIRRLRDLLMALLSTRWQADDEVGP
ncbi:hypothetical protein [Azospirillum canadense]|uniref:hypothetical protein n=1 Tax=Azospirillum canadense TaxID=403962 RepID=UPI0022279306|nr:hypothetical protein [Azospirillum canadense]MCW2239500.1 hypothetical protein [Azospirillum canadense]